MKEKKERIQIRIILIIAFAFSIYLFFQALGTVESSPHSTRIDYRIEVEDIEGMPCVIYKHGDSGGITCNWDEWEKGE
ncbi:MAG: hypothetical protein ACXADW_21000 [Candidatus Hodarchaeales archaeon]|jgi:hypothetical protein